jgi:hypothetical protein
MLDAWNVYINYFFRDHMQVGVEDQLLHCTCPETTQIVGTMVLNSWLDKGDLLTLANPSSVNTSFDLLGPLRNTMGRIVVVDRINVLSELYERVLLVKDTLPVCSSLLRRSAVEACVEPVTKRIYIDPYQTAALVAESSRKREEKNTKLKELDIPFFNIQYEYCVLQTETCIRELLEFLEVSASFSLETDRLPASDFLNVGILEAGLSNFDQVRRAIVSKGYGNTLVWLSPDTTRNAN